MLLGSCGLAGLFDAEAETAPGGEAEARLCRWLFDGGRNCASYADEELSRPNEAHAVHFEEPSVDFDVPSLDLAALEHALFADDQARVRGEDDRAALEVAIDLYFCSVAELELRVLQDVSYSDVALHRGR